MITALDAGVDEVVVGTLRAREVVARARHIIVRRHRIAKPNARISLGVYTLDRDARDVTISGIHVHLTARELSIAWLFFSNPGLLITRKEIAHAIWCKDLEIAGHSLEQHIYRLRNKLELDKYKELKLRTSYSLGYVLELVEGFGSHIQRDAGGRERSFAADATSSAAICGP